jgi:hypothetical protein
VHFHGISKTYNLPYDESQSLWDEYWAYIASKRNSVIAFENLVLPCQSVSGLSLIEKDDFESNDYSN